MNTLPQTARPAPPSVADRRVGVLSHSDGAARLLMLDRYPITSHPFPWYAESLEDLLAFCEGGDIHELWLMPSYTAALGLPARLPKRGLPSTHPFTITSPAWSISSSSLRPWYHCFRRGSASVEISIPQYDDASPWWAKAEPDVLLRALRTWHELLTVPYKRSTRRPPLGQLLLQLHSGPGRTPMRPLEMPPPALDGGLEQDLYSWRALTAGERTRRYIVAWDCNASYLAACSSLRCGAGELKHFDANGLYRNQGAYVSVEQPPGYWRLVRDGKVADEWVTTPSYAHVPNAPFGIAEGWSWTESARPLESWYRVLRDARTTLIAGGQPHDMLALRALKAGYGQFLGGFLASTLWDRSGDPLYRPDIRHHIIATARMRRLSTVANLCSVDQEPVAVLNDALYFATDDQNMRPETLSVSTGIGHYKRLGAIPLAALPASWPNDDPTGTLHRLFKEERIT